MKVYRMYFDDDIKNGIYRGESKVNPYINLHDIARRSERGKGFMNWLYYELHAPEKYDFDIPPNENALFYLKEEIYNKHKEMIDDMIYTAMDRWDIKINVLEIDLDLVKKYTCFYQDEKQICLEIFN